MLTTEELEFLEELFLNYEVYIEEDSFGTSFDLDEHYKKIDVIKEKLGIPVKINDDI